MANNTSIKKLARERRRKHIRKNLSGTAEKPRLVVFRSNKQIYGQIIDDVSRSTLISASSQSKEIAADVQKAKSKTEVAQIVGKYLAEQAVQKKLSTVVFDRAGYIYHGRVKAFADGAREGGLKF